MTEKTKKIVHLSDLHIGEKYKGRPIFRADIAEKIVEEVNGIKPDIILISGDITADGNEPEYKQARAFLSKFNTPIVKDPNPNIVQELDDFSSPIFSVPGNHDSRHGGLEPEVGYLKKMDDAWSEFSHKTANMKSKEADALFVNTFKPVILNHYNECSGMNAFEKYIGKAQKIYNGHGFYVVGVNSSGIGLDMNGDGKIDNEDLRLAQSLGLVGVETMPWIRENLRKADPDDFKIVIMHHHLIGIPATGNDDNVLMDSGDILKLLVDEKVDLVLNGHKHMPWFWNLNGLPILDGGTCTSTSTYCENNYNLIEIGKDITIKRRWLGVSDRWEDVARYPNKKYGKKRNVTVK